MSIPIPLPAGVTSVKVMCPGCGWDDSEQLVLRDWYAEEFPPIPPPRNVLGRYAVDGDPERGIHMGHGFDCPDCGLELDLDVVVPRESKQWQPTMRALLATARDRIVNDSDQYADEDLLRMLVEEVDAAELIAQARINLGEKVETIDQAMSAFYGHGAHDEAEGSVEETGAHMVRVGRFVQTADDQGFSRTAYFPTEGEAHVAISESIIDPAVEDETADLEWT